VTHRKRILLIKPSAYDAAGHLIRVRRSFFPSRTLPYLAASIPPQFDVRLLDDAVQDVTGKEDADDCVVIRGEVAAVQSGEGVAVA